MDLYARLRSKPVLHRSWAKVRASGLKSDSEQTKRETIKFDENWFNNLAKIRHHLKEHKFAFAGETGVTPRKGKGKVGVRPLVLAPISSRIVRRAILEVLQGYGDGAPNPRHRWEGVSAVRAIMQTPTSVGGVAHRGVPHGLAIVDHAVQEGRNWFVRSDIKNFFTRIPKAEVNAFIGAATNDELFIEIFEQALATNLENMEELKERNIFKLFPDPEVGVAQGSALSALAGNIVLHDFDMKMNDRGIVCVRYIDDFILLGESKLKVDAAYRSARAMLKKMGMDVYGLDDSTAWGAGKVEAGNIHNGTDFLGYRISGRSRQPCSNAIAKFLAKLDKIIADAHREMKAAADGSSVSHRLRYHQSMVELHKVVWGWSQSFRHTTARHVFVQLDREIDERINRLNAQTRQLVPAADAVTRRRVLGVHLLTDTANHPLPTLSGG